MDFAELLSDPPPFVKKYFVPLLFAFFGLIFFGYGLIQFLFNSQPQEEMLFDGQVGGSAEPIATKSAEILVDVSGAVEKPGVYPLKKDSRVQDGLVAAGGLSSSADREWVAKRLNLAAKVADGAKIYIPKVGEVAESRGSSSAEGRLGILGAESQVNINTASSSELEALPGIGAVTAQKIIDGRPYGSIEDLLNKKIVGKSVYEKIKDRVAVY